MKKTLFVMVLWAAALCAQAADMMYRDQTIQVTAHATPCVDQTAQEIIRAGGLDPAKWLASTTVFQGRTIPGCWVVSPRGNVVVVDAEADVYQFTADSFKPLGDT